MRRVKPDILFHYLRKKKADMKRTVKICPYILPSTKMRHLLA